MPKRKNKTRNRYKDYAAYLGLRFVTSLLHMFPLQANYRTARLFGNLFYKFSRRHRERALAHLRKSFPDWSEDKLCRVAKASMRNLVYLGLEFLYTTRMITPTRWRKHIKLKNMSESLRLLLERKKGVIFLTGHFGNWEVVGYTMAALGFPNSAVARFLDNPYLNEYVLGVRQDKGMTILDKRGATAEIPRLLDSHEAVSFIADQDAGRRGMFVDFFGRKASTYKSIALLAMQYEIPVVVGYGQRIDEQYQFEIGIEKIIWPKDWADQDDPQRYITQEYTTALENVIRRAPEQYLWIHRRWKHRPKGEPPAENGVA